MQIASAQVNAAGQRADTGSVYINVASLPGDVASTGAVGDFTLSAWVDKQAVAAGDEVVLFVRLTGIGNLNYLQMPQADFGEAVLLEKTEAAEYSADKKPRNRFLAGQKNLVTKESTA